jgi:hypothetical protein
VSSLDYKPIKSTKMTIVRVFSRGVEGRVYNRQNAVTEQHRKAFENHTPTWPDEPIPKNAREYVFVSPTGVKMKVKGLRGICRAYNLNPSHMSKVARGIYVQHRGWTAADTSEEDNEI